MRHAFPAGSQVVWTPIECAFYGALVAAAIITPTSDILNTCLFDAPMIALYGISIGVAWLVNSTRERGARSV
jgi:sec-independent protein translocase protein TatC